MFCLLFCLLCLTADPPTITGHPLDTSSTLHGDVRFTAEATGSGQLEFCWEWKQAGSQEWQPLSNNTEKFQGVATTVLTVTNAKRSDDGSRYRCVISNAAGMVVSDVAKLTVGMFVHDCSYAIYLNTVCCVGIHEPCMHALQIPPAE